MSAENILFIKALFAGFLFGSWISGFGVTVYRDYKDLEFQSKAVELHAAEWAVDPKTGKTTFTWKENK